MDAGDFVGLRQSIGKTQEEMAKLLCVSVSAIRAYEQGWRKIPVHAERQLIFLAVRKRAGLVPAKPCWEQLDCPDSRRESCPVWEFSAGDLCWLVNGTACHGELVLSWREKMAQCRDCSVLEPLLGDEQDDSGAE